MEPPKGAVYDIENINVTTNNYLICKDIAE